MLSRKYIINRRKGRPRVRLLEMVENDVRTVNITDWRRKVADRKQLRNIISNIVILNR